MRILFVSPQFPRDLSRSVYGGHQRMRMWLDAIHSLGAELDILFFAPSASLESEADAASVVAQQLLESWGIRCNVVLCKREPEESQDQSGGFLQQYFGAYVRPTLGPSQHPHFRAFLGRRQRDAFAHCMARSPAVVLFHRLYTTAPAMSLPLGGARVLLDVQDLEHRRFAREVAQPPRWRLKPLLYLQVPALWWGERRAVVRSESAFVCSETDRRYMRRTMLVGNVDVIPNAVERVDDSRLAAEPNVLFLGAYDYPPNVVAADYLIREVWPRLSRSCPNARLLIAGPGSEVVAAFHNPPPGVEFLGFVSDLPALYRRTRVACCPIQSGTGTRIKILEAASYGVPVVSTPMGAEGLAFAPETEILLRTNAADLAAACVALLTDDVRAHRMGALARQRVRAEYSRDAVVRRMRGVLAGDTLFEQDDSARLGGEGLQRAKTAFRT